MNRGANSLSVTKQQVRKRYNLCSLQFFSFAFVWHFRNFSVVGDKKKFLKKFSQNFGKIALCGVVGIERKSSGFGKLPNKQKSPAVGRQKTDDFTERVPLSYACSAVRADQLSGKQRCLGRRIVSGNLFRRLIDFLDSLPQLRPDNCLVRALMGNPFQFRFPYHGLILIGTGAGTVLCERTDINIIVQKASDGCVSP